MDPSAQPTQTDQPINRAQPPATNSRQPIAADSSSPPSISGNKEAEPAIIASETIPDIETVDLQTSDTEPVIEAKVEQVIEKSPDHEKPELSEAVKQAGVTHSGPGVIPDTTVKVVNNKFGVKELDVSFSEAVREEKRTSFKSSKHWLMAIYEYMWRKINPKLRKEYVKN